MKTQAQRIHHYGGPEVIRLEEIMLPRPGPLEVLIDVRAAGVGIWDTLVRSGLSEPPLPLPLTLGAALAGMVLETGIGVVHFAAGVEVYGTTNARFVGAHARHAIVDTKRIARKPPGLDFVTAAAAALDAIAGDVAGPSEVELVLPFAEARRAHELLGDRPSAAGGKIVLVMEAVM